MTQRTRSTLLAGLSVIALAAPVAAQQAPAPEPSVAAAAEADPASTIIVTGTRRTDRTVADSPVPIDVIGTDAIVNTGATETNKILNQLVPSFNFPQPAIADGSDALRPATLRGLSPDQTLVLINGKRRHVSALLNINGTVGRGSAAVDLNLVPGLAISRIEVLRDGASSQYGSDAIAGVINIQLKKANNGGRASVTYGKYISTLDDAPELTGLTLNGAGQPQLDPLDNRYFLTTTDGARKVRDGDQLTTGINVGLPIGRERLRQSDRRISQPRLDQPPGVRHPAQLYPPLGDHLRSARNHLRPPQFPLRRSRDARFQHLPQQRVRVRRRVGSVRLRDLRQSQFGKRGQLSPAERRGQPRFLDHLAQHDAQQRQFRRR